MVLGGKPRLSSCGRLEGRCMTCSSQFRLYLFLGLLVLTVAAGCAHEPLKGIENWQDHVRQVRTRGFV